MSTVQDKDMWTMTLFNANAAGTTQIYHPHYNSANANRMPVTEDMIIREFYAVHDPVIGWPSQVTSITFKLVIDNTEVAGDQIFFSDGDREYIHIYKIGTVAIPIIIKTGQLIHMIVTIPANQGSKSVRFAFGAWGTWLRDDL